jgi:glutamine amidotransferase
MGWNQIRWTQNVPMFDGLDAGASVYFAHSYHVVPADETVVAATTDYGYPFVSAVWKDNVFATQFHPEKSQAVGLRLLKNFVDL